MRLKIFLICFFILSAHALTLAEFFRYTDKNDIVHYTDNYAHIPPEHRQQVIRLVGTEDNSSQALAPGNERLSLNLQNQTVIKQKQAENNG